MGSCFSKKMEKEKKEKEKEKKGSAESRDPPAPESPQEEKVKEVLSETPKPRASTRAREELFKKEEEKEVEIKNMRTESEDTSDLYSESFSASSTQKTTKAAADEVEQKRRAVRSPSKKRSFSGELQPGRKVGRGGVEVGCRSGSGRSSPSPPARRTVPAADAARHRHAAQCEKFRRDHGGDRVAKRRSVSPAAKQVVPDHHRTPAAAATPARGQHCRSLSASRISGPGKVADAEEEESLENPLVSLECFIFL